MVPGLIQSKEVTSKFNTIKTPQAYLQIILDVIFVLGH